MKWIEIKDVTPNSPRQVLLGEFKQVKHYGIGELGGSKNAPDIAVQGVGDRMLSVRATHWCELTSPRQIDKD